MVFPERYVQLSVRAKGDAPALVTAVVAGRQVIDDGRQAGSGPALVGPAHDSLAALVVGAAVERVHEMVALKRRAHPQAKQAPFAGGRGGHRRKNPGRFAVERPDGAGTLGSGTAPGGPP